MGLFWQSPALLFFIVGAVFMFLKRRYRAEAILALWIISSYMIILSGYYLWWGGSALGARYIIPMLPYFCILLVFVPKRLTWPLLALGLVTFGQMLNAAASIVQVPNGTWAVNISKLGFFEYTNIYSYCLKLLLKGKFGQNLGIQLLGLRSWYSLIPVLVVITGATFFFLDGMKIFHPQNRPSLR
jgi:hypothetical protein